MAGYQNYQSTPPANGTLERRLTTIEMWILHLRQSHEELKDVDTRLIEMVDGIKRTAFQAVMGVAAGAIMILVNILLSKLTG